MIPKYGLSYLDNTRMPPGNLHKFRKYFGFMDEIDGYAGDIDAKAGDPLAHASGSRQCRHGSAVPGRRSRTHAVRSEPEASATAHARGLAGRSGSPLLETGPGIGNGDAAVADASGSDVRDRPQDWLSGILIRVASGVGDSDRGTGFQPVCLSGSPPGEGLLNCPKYGPQISFQGVKPRRSRSRVTRCTLAAGPARRPHPRHLRPGGPTAGPRPAGFVDRFRGARGRHWPWWDGRQTR